jgi:hypothetical protein
MKKPLRVLLGVVGVAAVALGLCAALPVAALLLFPPPVDYVVRAEFQELPASEQPIEQWLLNEPGVYIGSVRREGKPLCWFGGIPERAPGIRSPRTCERSSRGSGTRF